jgi:hypothetical protein
MDVKKKVFALNLNVECTVQRHNKKLLESLYLMTITVICLANKYQYMILMF